MLHEIPDQLGIMRSLTKWAARINSPRYAPTLVAEAFHQLHSGRPRPVGLEVPMDVLSQRAEVDAVILPSGAPAVNTELLALAAKLLVQAKNPMIYVGGGAQGVSAEVLILAEMLEAPVVGYRTGMGIG